MKILLVVGLVSAAAVPAWAQEGAQEQDPRVTEKLQEIWEKQLELKGLRAEFLEIYDQLYGLGPQYLTFSAKGLYTWWDDDLDLRRDAGFGVDAILGHRASGEEGSDVIGISYLPLGVRYWRAEDQESDEDVSIISYRVLGMSGEYRNEGSNASGFRVTIVGGLTRFAGDIPGVEGDTAPTLSSEMEFHAVRAGGFVVGGGAAWDMVRTRFRLDHTETVHNFSVTLTLGFSF